MTHVTVVAIYEFLTWSKKPGKPALHWLTGRTKAGMYPRPWKRPFGSAAASKNGAAQPRRF